MLKFDTKHSPLIYLVKSWWISSMFYASYDIIDMTLVPLEGWFVVGLFINNPAIWFVLLSFFCVYTDELSISP